MNAAAKHARELWLGISETREDYRKPKAFPSDHLRDRLREEIEELNQIVIYTYEDMSILGSLRVDTIFPSSGRLNKKIFDTTEKIKDSLSVVHDELYATIDALTAADQGDIFESRQKMKREAILLLSNIAKSLQALVNMFASIPRDAAKDISKRSGSSESA